MLTFDNNSLRDKQNQLSANLHSEFCIVLRAYRDTSFKK